VALELQRRDKIMQGADIPELAVLEPDLIVQRLVPRPAFYLTAGRECVSTACIVSLLEI